MTIRIGIAGAAGRMGGALIRAGAERDDMQFAALLVRDRAQATDLADHPGTAPLIVTEAKALFELSDVVIDFTSPAASLHHADIAGQSGRPLVIGTTGFDQAGEDVLAAASGRTALFRAANFSVGIALVRQFVEQAARVLDPSFDIEIIEMHHRSKRDAPSGTALLLGEAAARGRGGRVHAPFASADRSGERFPGEIGFAILRGGDIIGEHETIFAGEGERISLAHKATDRLLFARGALRAACWLHGRPAGLYGMDDMLMPESRS